MQDPSFSLGIEEEYLLVRTDTGDLAEAPTALMEACEADLEDQVSPEYMQCQIEIGTRVCETIDAARAANMRTIAAAYGYVAHDDDPSDWDADHCVQESGALQQLLTDCAVLLAPDSVRHA